MRVGIVFSSVLLVALSLQAEVINTEMEQKITDEWDKLIIPNIGADVEIGAWYASWTQNSQTDKKINNPINVKYNIDDSVATIFKINARYNDSVNGKFEYYNTTNTKNDEEVKGLSGAVSVLEAIKNVSVEFRFIKADFNGNIFASRGQETSSGTFETELNVADIIVYPFNHIFGVGYKKYKYDFPQDLYVVNNKTQEIITSGLANIEYEGHFFEVVADNSRLKQDTNFIYSISMGIGELDANADGFEQYLTPSNAKFIDFIAGYRYKMNTSDFNLAVETGYRYNYLTSRYKTEGDYSMITEFSSRFMGPFAKFALSF